MFRHVLLVPLLLAACKAVPPKTGADTQLVATAELATQKGKKVADVTLEESPHGLVMVIEAQGLEPYSRHGLHVHEGSYCGPSFDGAGGHFAPDGSPHGGPHEPKSVRHAGDLGNVTADGDGVVRDTIVSSILSLDDGETAVMGRTLVLHEDSDDLESQPSGNAGARMACGVITPKG